MKSSKNCGKAECRQKQAVVQPGGSLATQPYRKCAFPKGGVGLQIRELEGKEHDQLEKNQRQAQAEEREWNGATPGLEKVSGYGHG